MAAWKDLPKSYGWLTLVCAGVVLGSVLWMTLEVRGEVYAYGFAVAGTAAGLATATVATDLLRAPRCLTLVLLMSAAVAASLAALELANTSAYEAVKQLAGTECLGSDNADECLLEQARKNGNPKLVSLWPAMAMILGIALGAVFAIFARVRAWRLEDEWRGPVAELEEELSAKEATIEDLKAQLRSAHAARVAAAVALKRYQR
jgi:hypothetical protein